MKKRFGILTYIVISVLLILFLTSRLMERRNQLEELESLNKVTTEEVESWKGKDGVNRYRISILETENTKSFLAYQTKDSMVRKLQDEVAKMKRQLKEKGSVTIFEEETIYEETTKKEPIQLAPNFTGFIMDSIANTWLDTKFGFKLDTLPEGGHYIDSVRFSLKVKNQYTITLGVEPTGFLGLGKGKPFAEVKNLNPYSEITAMRTYQVKQPARKRIGLGLYAGYGASTIDSRVHTGWQIGIGLNYTLINF